ncbi:PfaD family polyunsaturated fatty acid/polyketide biosynthesis protein [Streptomyces sp. NPDC008222]|uniref:PfaD family polyunsaturated fatty acid/polyketide biosynthesis protein n=1 Tax=Streptomyces sp. NPDC008222 TaxID=3364820 RepID=UPI0036EEB837
MREPLRWHPGVWPAAVTPDEIGALLADPRRRLEVVGDGAVRAVGYGGELRPGGGGFEALGSLPAMYPEWLGDPTFASTHRVRFPYIAGEMANGISTTRMVVAMARAGMLSFFGAGGLGAARVEAALRELSETLRSSPNWGVNLLHSPNEPGYEDRVVDLVHHHGVVNVSVSAFMDLTPAVVRCAATGLHTDPEGRIVRRTRLFAKVSRPEVAEKFMSPAPDELLRALLEQGRLTADEVSLARRIPLATDVTVEADSGGHTDNRPLTVILPAMLALRDTLSRRHGYAERVRVGAAGGLGDPLAVASAFACGADYVVTGTVNQRSVEAGTSDEVKRLLAEADLADVTMAPASDMFEYGIKVQVLRRGTMYANRAAGLYEAYCRYDSLERIPTGVRDRMERDLLRAGFDEAWAATRRYWADRDPDQIAVAERDPKHRMALVFRSYLGQASRWAITGEPSRRADYQVWCGPAIGSFNRWVAGSPLAEQQHCTVVQIARNLMEGAAVVTRTHQLRSYGVRVSCAGNYVPRLLS